MLNIESKVTIKVSGSFLMFADAASKWERLVKEYCALQTNPNMKQLDIVDGDRGERALQAKEAEVDAAEREVLSTSNVAFGFQLRPIDTSFESYRRIRDQEKVRSAAREVVAPVPKTQAMKQLGNSVAVDAVQAVAAEIIARLERRSQ